MGENFIIKRYTKRNFPRIFERRGSGLLKKSDKRKDDASFSRARELLMSVLKQLFHHNYIIRQAFGTRREIFSNRPQVYRSPWDVPACVIIVSKEQNRRTVSQSETSFCEELRRCKTTDREKPATSAVTDMSPPRCTRSCSDLSLRIPIWASDRKEAASLPGLMGVFCSEGELFQQQIKNRIPPTDFLYGSCISTYPPQVQTDIIADPFLVEVLDETVVLLAIADGCNWGLWAAHAAQDAILGFRACFKLLFRTLLWDSLPGFARALLESVHAAHDAIKESHATYLKNHTEFAVETPPGTTTLLGGIL